jgi:hypothetical protein
MFAPAWYGGRTRIEHQNPVNELVYGLMAMSKDNAVQGIITKELSHSLSCPVAGTVVVRVKPILKPFSASIFFNPNFYFS